MKSRLAHLFRGSWTGVTFYKNKPDLPSVGMPEAVRFCEATRVSGIMPVLLDETNVTCPGARYTFGWDGDFGNFNKMECFVRYDKLTHQFRKLISRLPHLEEPIACIGLNTEEQPDLFLSYLLPRDAMNLIRKHNIKSGSCLDTSLCSMASICGGIAVKTYLEQTLTLSFGCEDSRRYAKIGRDRIAVGIPQILVEDYLHGG